MSGKPTCLENRAVNSRHDRSVEEDLKEHFSVLDDISHKFDDYIKIPTIPSGR